MQVTSNEQSCSFTSLQPGQHDIYVCAIDVPYSARTCQQTIVNVDPPDWSQVNGVLNIIDLDQLTNSRDALTVIQAGWLVSS